MSGAIGAAVATSYFREEFEHARGSYYAEEERTVGRWRGELAEYFGLSGAVNREDFERLCEGQDPRTGEQLVRHVRPHERTNSYGDTIETGGHRAGCDITFSAPKSVSLAALVGGDGRIREAHAEAVTAALREVERYAQARPGGNAKAETTGKLLFASFEHDAARPDEKDGFAAPDLHTHNFTVNLTLTADGKIKPVQPFELYRSQKYGTAVYRAVLAEKLQRLGYEIDVDERTGAPEIRGISREYIEAASPRQRDIKKAAEARNLTSTRSVAVRNRRTKTYDREEMKERHQELDRQFSGQAHAVVREARTRAQEMRALLWDEAGNRARAQEAVTFAVEKASEREPVGDTRRLMTDALRQHLGRTTFEAVSEEMRGREERGQLAGIVLDEAGMERLKAEKTLRRETENVERVRAWQGTQQPLVERVPATVTTSQDVTLNESQRAAFEQVIVSRDQIIGLQAKAGVEKTNTLAAVREAAISAGYDVQGFAPTPRAARLLAESGMETRTLHKFLRQKDDPEAPPRFLVLDESGLASTKRVNDFLSRVRLEDKVLLVGDMRGHEGVEAGLPFAHLVRHGMETAQLGQTERQRQEPLREAAENPREISDGQKGRTQTETRADRARGDGEAGETARAGRNLSAFDRGRVHEYAARALADDGADSRNNPGRGREGAPGGARGEAGREREREGAERREVRRAEPGADGHERAADGHGRARHESEGGHAQQPAPDGRRDRGTKVTAEQSRSAPGAGAAERHAAPAVGVDGLHAAPDVVPPVAVAERVPAAPADDRAGGGELAARTKTLPAPAGREQPAAERTDSRDGGGAPPVVLSSDPGGAHHRAPDRGHLDSCDAPPLGVGPSPAGRSAGRGGAHHPDLDRGDPRVLVDGDEDVARRHISARGDDHLHGGVGLQRLPGLDEAEAGHRTAGQLGGGGRPGIADEVRAILDRPAQVERTVAEVLRLADGNRAAQGRLPIDAGAREYMRAALTSAAERPPSEAQAGRDRQIAEALGQEAPRHENALESTLYGARHAPNRGELLDRFTDAAESAYARDQTPAIEHAEPSHNISMSR
jgi:conjugative relaxase-like TrwC/TraI family protein